MFIETTKHNQYSYLRRTNEIVCGVVEEDDFVWRFEPLNHFGSMPDIEMVILCLTEQCNLRCTYCCYSGGYANNRTHSSVSMTEKDIDDVLAFVDNTIRKRPFRLAFYGGEPLVNFPLLQSTVIRSETLWGNDVTFSISTNAVLLNKERLEWLVKHHLELFISIDGTAEFHDKNRIDANGVGSFHHVHKAIAYIKGHQPDYMDHVHLMMTLPSIADIEKIAESWNEDEILKDLQPSNISALAPNFASGVVRKDYDMLRQQYLHLLDVYERHTDWLVLKKFFDSCIAYWKNRSIVEADGEIPMATCMPLNTKIYIDAMGDIAVCEKISDHYRIGNIHDGFNWKQANEHVRAYYKHRVHHCVHCPAIRMCDLCLTAIEFNDEQWDVLCHNERVYARLYMLLFCEMVERGMIK